MCPLGNRSPADFQSYWLCLLCCAHFSPGLCASVVYICSRPEAKLAVCLLRREHGTRAEQRCRAAGLCPELSPFPTSAGDTTAQSPCGTAGPLPIASDSHFFVQRGLRYRARHFWLCEGARTPHGRPPKGPATAATSSPARVWGHSQCVSTRFVKGLPAPSSLEIFKTTATEHQRASKRPKR